MKTLFFLSFSMTCMIALADNAQTGNTINVNVKGCCAEQKCKPKIVTKVVEKVVEKKVEVPMQVPYYINTTKTVTKTVHKKNRVSVLFGSGPARLEQPSPSQVNLIRGPIGGLMYQRSFGYLNGGIQLQTNQTVLGTVGIDF